MGDDDTNEGRGPGECLEHVWEFTGTQLVHGEGAYMEFECVRCEAIELKAPPKRLPGPRR